MRVLIYCRVSSAGQEDNSSLGTQEERCRAYAAAHDWIVVAVEREVHSGAELFGRPSLSKVRESVRAGEVDVLLAYALDRLSRKQTHVAIIAEECEAAGAKLAFVTEDFEEGPVGTFIRGAKAFAAELEREKILERTMRGRRRRVENGRPLPGLKPLYGYRWTDETRSRLEEDPTTAPVARRVFADALQGVTTRMIAKRLTAEGVPTPTNRSPIWPVATIYDLLRNPAYMGRPLALRTRTVRVGGKRRLVNVPPDECLLLPDGTVPALVDPAVFEAVALRLTANKAQAVRNNRHPEDSLLRAGFARCGYCGGTLTVKSRRGGRGHYACGTLNQDRHGCPPFSISAAILDPAVWSHVETVIRNPTLIAAEAERYRSSDPNTVDLDALARRLRDVEKRRANIARAVAVLDDPHASAPLVAELKSLADQKRALEADEAELLASRQVIQANRARLDDLAEWCERVADNLPCLTYQERRDLLAALGVSVRVWRGDHEQRWELTMAVQEVAAPCAGSIVTTIP